MARAAAAAGFAVKVFVEKHQITPVRVVRVFPKVPMTRAGAILVRQKDASQSTRQLTRDFLERHHVVILFSQRSASKIGDASRGIKSAEAAAENENARLVCHFRLVEQVVKSLQKSERSTAALQDANAGVKLLSKNAPFKPEQFAERPWVTSIPF